MDQLWTQRLINPQALAELYDEEPSLQGFFFREMRLERRGPTFFLCGDLPRFPDHPRTGWDAQSSSLEVRFSLSAVDHFSATGSAASGPIDLSIDRAEDGFGVTLSGTGDTITFEVAGIALQILGMKPY